MVADDRSDDDDWIVCALWRNGHWLAGSVREHCAKCGAEITLSTEGVAFRVLNPGARLACIPCWQKAGQPATRAVPGAVERVQVELQRRRMSR